MKSEPGSSRSKVRPSKQYHPDVNLNLNVRGLAQSATLEINERSDWLSKSGSSVFRMGLGQSPFPVPRSVVDELKANAHQKAYLPVKGLGPLRESVAAYIRRTQGIEYSGDDVLIGPGSKELMFILQLVYYGDLVIPTPSWVSYAPQAHIIGRHIQWLTTKIDDDWRLTAEEIENVCQRDPGRPRLIVINYPNNPSGVSYSVDQLRELAKTARKYRVVLLSDEIYGELDHEGRHVSIAKFYPEGTVISTGLSKWCGAGGWRLGTFIFPRSLRWLMDSMAVVASETYTSTSAPIQYAAVRAFDGGIEIEEYLAQSRRILKALGTRIASRLQGAGVITPMPEGAFYLFTSFEPFRESLQARGVKTSIDLCNLLLEETGVAALPGAVFGRLASELTARLAYVDFDGGRALTAARRTPLRGELDEEFLNYYCAPPIEASNRICDWVAAGI
jgi:aspartate aminotransferase